MSSDKMNPLKILILLHFLLLGVVLAGCVKEDDTTSLLVNDPLATAYGLDLIEAPSAPDIDEWLLVSAIASQRGSLNVFDSFIPPAACEARPVPGCYIEVVPLLLPDENKSGLSTWSLKTLVDIDEERLLVGPGSVTLHSVDPDNPEEVLETWAPTMRPSTSLLKFEKSGPARMVFIARSEDPLRAGMMFRFVEPKNGSFNSAEDAIASMNSSVGLVSSRLQGHGYQIGLFGPMPSPDDSLETIQARTTDVTVNRNESHSAFEDTVEYSVSVASAVKSGWGRVEFTGSQDAFSMADWSVNGSLHGIRLSESGKNHPLLGQIDASYGHGTRFNLEGHGEGPMNIHLRYSVQGARSHGSIIWSHIDIGMLPEALVVSDT